MDLDDLFSLRSKVDGLIVKGVAEVERNKTFRDDGVTSPETWLVERFGVSVATARAYVQVVEKAKGLPHLVSSLSAGEVSFDKVRVQADWRRLGPSAGCATRPRSARCVSWPTSPVRPVSGGLNA